MVLSCTVWRCKVCGLIAVISLVGLPLGFPQWWWPQCRTGMLCSEEASGQLLAMMYRWMCGWLDEGPRWILAAGDRCSCGPLAACCMQWNAPSMRHRGRAVGSRFFPLDVTFVEVLSTVTPFQIVVANQPTKDRTDSGDLRFAQVDVPHSA